MTGNSPISRSTFLGLLATVLLVACTDSTEQATGAEDRVELKSIRVNDTTLHYIERGQGTPVVFVHGNLGDYRTWDGQLDAFSEEYRAISYSRRYHYPNEFPPDALEATQFFHIEDLRAFIEALDSGPVHLVGHSGGGVISLIFTREYPEYVLSLTLAEPAVTRLLASTPDGAAVLQSFAEDVREPATAAFQAGNEEQGIRQFVNGVQGVANAFDNLPDKFRSGMLQNAFSLRVSLLDNVRTPRLTCEDARGIRVPALLIHGESSPELFVRINDALAKCMPSVERALLPSASHSLEMENPNGFNEIVLNFLERNN